MNNLKKIRNQKSEIRNILKQCCFKFLVISFSLFTFSFSNAQSTISGFFTYDNNASTPLDSVWVFLMQNGVKIDSVQANINGFYLFNNVANGTYNITASTTKPWGNVNITDVVLVRLHFGNNLILNSSIKHHAADVNNSIFINVTDAVKISRRFSGADSSFLRGNWIFEKPGGSIINVSIYLNDTVIVNGTNVIQDFKGRCVGDVN